METLYNNEVREFVQTRPWPKGLAMTVHEQTEPEPHLNFVFYRDNWLLFDGDTQLKIAMLIKEVMETLRKRGVPCYMGKMEHAPRN